MSFPAASGALLTRTATQLVVAALRLCREGLKAPGRTASTEQLTDGRLRLNEILDAWGADRLTIPSYLRTTHTLTANTTSYTIGIGGNINIVRPVSIDWAGLIIDTAGDPTTEIPIEVFTPQRWRAILQKGLSSSLAQGIYYDHAWTAGLGRIEPWPVPDVGTTQLVIYSYEALTEFADLTTAYSAPPGYMRAIRLALAVELAPEFGGSTRPTLAQDAKDALGIIKSANLRIVELQVDPALVSREGLWNWRTDTYNR